MAVMQSCCCWRSVRRGSFACVVYTMLYYSVMAVTMSTVLLEESQYLSGSRSLPKSNSILEPEVSPITLRFNIILLICSSCGIICCLLLLYGLLKDKKLFLIPWICVIIICSFVDISHLLYLFFFITLAFNPTTAMVVTLDFFLLCLNIYSVFCVIAQYQEYAAGRGTALDDCEQRMPVARYTVQPTATATSCLSSRRTPTNNEARVTPTTSVTPSQSPTIFPGQPIVERSPTNEQKQNRKHVQFPDTTSNSLLDDKMTDGTVIDPKSTIIRSNVENKLHSEQNLHEKLNSVIGDPTISFLAVYTRRILEELPHQGK